MRFHNTFKVFTIVVTYNALDWIDKCLSSLQASSYPLETIVIDNCSTDGTIEYMEKYFPKVKVLRQNKNLGFGQANNIAIKEALAAAADFIFLLNQDAWILRETIERLVEIHTKHPDYGILSPVHLNRDFTKVDYNFSTYIGPATCPDLLSDLYLNRLKDVYTVDFVNAASWFMKSDCVRAVGCFDKLFFHYGEDVNYCQRVLYHGFKIGVCPSLKVVHDRDDRNGLISPAYQGYKTLKTLTLINLADVTKKRFFYSFSRFYLRTLSQLCINVMSAKWQEAKLSARIAVFAIFSAPQIIRSRKRNSIPLQGTYNKERNTL